MMASIKKLSVNQRSESLKGYSGRAKEVTSGSKTTKLLTQTKRTNSKLETIANKLLSFDKSCLIAAKDVAPAGDGGDRKSMRTPATGNDALIGTRKYIKNIVMPNQRYGRRNTMELLKSKNIQHSNLQKQWINILNEEISDPVVSYISPVSLPTLMELRTKIATEKATTTGNQTVKTKDPESPSTKASAIALPLSPSSPPPPPSTPTTPPAKADKLVKEHIDSLSETIDELVLAEQLNSQQGSTLKDPTVIISVRDQSTGTISEFVCAKSLLIKHMGYFADVSKRQNLEDIEISIHGDILIFDWLMHWIKFRAQQENLQQQQANETIIKQPTLNPDNIVAVILSARFLKMEPLLAECLTYCHLNLRKLVTMPNNLNCLSPDLLDRLGAMFKNIELEMVRDHKERLTAKIWLRFIEKLFEPKPDILRGHYYSLNRLVHCTRCNKYINKDIESYISCTPGNLYLNCWGQLINKHVHDPDWNIKQYLIQLYEGFKSWRLVYWKLWSQCHFLYCGKCEIYFPINEMYQCHFHPQPEVVSEAESKHHGSYYPCCGQPALGFKTVKIGSGCQLQKHCVELQLERDGDLLEIVERVTERLVLCDNLNANPKNKKEINQPFTAITLIPKHRRLGLLPDISPGSEKLDDRVPCESNNSLKQSNESSVKTKNICMPYRSRICYASSTDDNDCESGSCEKKGTLSKNGYQKTNMKVSGRSWSSELPAHLNQDYQREYEEKIMKRVVEAVYHKVGGKLRNLEDNNTPVGGSYIRLEAECLAQIKLNQSSQNINDNQQICTTGTNIFKQSKQK